MRSWRVLLGRPASHYERLELELPGIGLPWNIQFLYDIISPKKPTLVFLCETIGRKDKMEWVRRRVGFEGLLEVEPQGKNEGLALLWRDNVQANLLRFSQNHIDVEVKVRDMQPWRLTGFYGEPNRNQRRKTRDF